ncbi:hypothetical protein BT69DRAFT_1318253 [Atractiella rhizophila]|nr:hypothetical protein BT69DRAFT_1318253 [Atractiella rhizophila]
MVGVEISFLELCDLVQERIDRITIKPLREEFQAMKRTMDFCLQGINQSLPFIKLLPSLKEPANDYYKSSSFSSPHPHPQKPNVNSSYVPAEEYLQKCSDLQEARRQIHTLLHASQTHNTARSQTETRLRTRIRYLETFNRKLQSHCTRKDEECSALLERVVLASEHNMRLERDLEVAEGAVRELCALVREKIGVEVEVDVVGGTEGEELCVLGEEAFGVDLPLPFSIGDGDVNGGSMREAEVEVEEMVMVREKKEEDEDEDRMVTSGTEDFEDSDSMEEGDDSPFSRTKTPLTPPPSASPSPAPSPLDSPCSLPFKEGEEAEAENGVPTEIPLQPNAIRPIYTFALTSANQADDHDLLTSLCSLPTATATLTAPGAAGMNEKGDAASTSTSTPITLLVCDSTKLTEQQFALFEEETAPVVLERGADVLDVLRETERLDAVTGPGVAVVGGMGGGGERIVAMTGALSVEQFKRIVRERKVSKVGVLLLLLLHSLLPRTIWSVICESKRIVVFYPLSLENRRNLEAFVSVENPQRIPFLVVTTPSCRLKRLRSTRDPLLLNSDLVKLLNDPLSALCL